MNAFLSYPYSSCTKLYIDRLENEAEVYEKGEEREIRRERTCSGRWVLPTRYQLNRNRYLVTVSYCIIEAEYLEQNPFHILKHVRVCQTSCQPHKSP